MDKENTPFSTRRLTRESGAFTRTSGRAQSLERGLGLLRAFAAGAPILTNAQLAERTNLPRSTVSRLTHSLVMSGFLEYERGSEGYRLGPVVLALARTFHVGRSELNLALPLMRQVATGLRVNVALSIADDLSMIYLDTFRESRGPLRREIAAGKRLSMATSSAGHSYIGSLRGPPQRDLLARLAKASGQKWPEHQAAIKKSLTMLARYGYCHSTSLGLEGIACTLVGPDGITYAVSLSVSTGDLDGGKMVSHFVPVLHKLVADIQAVWSEYEQSGARN